MRQQTFFDDPELAAVPAGVMPKLNELQQDLFTRGRALYRDGVRRAIWQAPCGSGKTWLAAEQTKLALEKPDKVVLHIVHRRRLVDQMVSTLQRFGISACPIMDGRSSWTSRAYCASRDTLLSMVKNGIELPRASLIIPDECHVAAKEVNDWYLSHCPDAFWTGYTATPIRPDGSSLNPPYQAMASMKPASHLIAAGRLCPVKVYNPDAVGQRRRKGEKVKPVGNPVDHWRKYADGLPTVVFASNKSASREVCRAYNAAGIYAEHIDSDTDDDAREDVYERSRTGRTLVICNCGVLIEGVDLPWLVCCQILRGCNSLVLWIQAMGRIMRAFAGKLFGIGLDHAGAAHEFGMPDSDYVWTLDDESANVKANKPPEARHLLEVQGGFPEQAGLPRVRQGAAMQAAHGNDGPLAAWRWTAYRIHRWTAARHPARRIRSHLARLALPGARKGLAHGSGSRPLQTQDQAATLGSRHQ